MTVHGYAQHGSGRSSEHDLSYACTLAPVVSALREQTLMLAPVLSDWVEPHVADLLSKLCDRVRQQTVKIAVIGQVKAGKSAVINALIQRPGLVPTDVNPWTAVVTRLHLGHPNGRTTGARFQFYDDAQWDELSKAGGQLRIVAERLLPDVDLDVFRAQLTEVRARAQRRLGSDFARLLGRTHDYDHVTPNQLASYVAAGDMYGERSEHDRLVYSDITATADVFLPAHPFNLPVTIIDTPGTNDPFMVRDEITLRSLDDAEVTIVVLSARQALSVADVALMRALSGVHKSRLIVFVNRCDELPGQASFGQASLPKQASATHLVRDHVTSFLHAEFGHDITVITGSALWANAAYSRDAALLIDLLAGGFANQAERVGIPIDDGVSSWNTAHPTASMPPVTETLLAASGLPQLIAAISSKIETSTFGTMINAAHDAMKRVSTHQETVARQALQLQEEGLQRAHYDAMTAGLEVQRLNQAAHRLEMVTAKLEQIALERRAEIEAVQRQGIAVLRQSLIKQIDAHLDRERTGYMLALDQQPSASGKALRLDISRLRKALEQVFLTEYKVLHTRVAGIQAAARATFRRVVTEELPRAELEVHAGPASNSFTFPRLAALRRVNSFHVDPKLWTAWRRKQTSLMAALEAFEAIVRQEFAVVADELAEAADASISATMIDLQRQLEQSVGTAVRVARLHRDAVGQRLEMIAEHGNAPNLLDAHLNELGAARERLTNLQNLSRMLTKGHRHERWADQEIAFT